MVYKISDNAHIIVENGETILVADTLKYEDSITIGSVDSSLSPTYITDNLSSPSYTFQGSTNGYVSGGSPSSIQIEKFPFAMTSGTATSVGDLTSNRGAVSGQSSASHGYTSGNSGVQTGIPVPQKSDAFKIDKFPFASDANATDVGQLSALMTFTTGQSSETNGYISGGSYQSAGSTGSIAHPAVIQGPIEKFPFAADTNSSLISELTRSRGFLAGISGSTHGYATGGSVPGFPSPTVNIIERFPFASDANATDVGDLSITRNDHSGHSSAFSGYAVAGNQESKSRDRFPFASDANGTDEGDLDFNRSSQAGTSGEILGCVAGGNRNSPPTGFISQIENFPFNASSSTEIGDLSSSTTRSAGQQV
jgi:hypothetical protein